jgi:DNA-binding protein YbaB
MKLMGLSNLYLDAKEQLLYIYNCYKTTRPEQSNIFTEVSKSYKQDMLDNAENIEREMEVIKNSLNSILQRYLYRDTTVSVVFDGINNQFLIDIDTTNKDGVVVKLSDSIIHETKVN